MAKRVPEDLKSREVIGLIVFNVLEKTLQEESRIAPHLARAMDPLFRNFSEIHSISQDSIAHVPLAGREG